MLEDKDIQKLIEVFATREELNDRATKEDLRNAVSEIQTSVDTYAKKADAYFQEMVMLTHKVDRHEKWIKQLADKLGVKLEY
jgi:uncharacterized coiled-coil DUF342 family protein